MIRVAVVGCGAHGRDHCRAFARLRRLGREVSVELVIDPDRARAAALGGEFGVSGVSTSLSALAEHNVDAVCVCSPTDTHVAIARVCSELGLPTLMEKPLAPTLAGVDEIIETFEQSSSSLFPGQSTRFDPVNVRLRAAIDDHTFGEIGLINIQVYQGYSWPGGWNAWQLDHDRSGGRILHLGIHDIDLVCWLLGSAPTLVRAHGSPDPSGRRGNWRSYDVQLAFPDGVIVLLAAEWAIVPATVLRKTVLLVGSKGQAYYDSSHDEYWTGTADRMIGYDQSTAAQLGHWLEVLEGNSEPLITSNQVRIASEVAIAAQRSAELGGEAIGLSTGAYRG